MVGPVRNVREDNMTTTSKKNSPITAGNALVTINMLAESLDKLRKGELLSAEEEHEMLRHLVEDVEASAAANKRVSSAAIRHAPHADFFEVGNTHVFFVPPSWCIGGTITAIRAGYLVLGDCVYIEGAVAGEATMTSPPKARSDKDMASKVGRVWPSLDGSALQASAILYVSAPCKNGTFRALARAEEASAIRGA